MTKPMFCYVMARVVDGKPVAPVKVGITNSLQGRLKNVQCAAPEEVVIVHKLEFPSRDMAFAFERAFHAVQREHHVRGEWFNIEPRKAAALLDINLEAMMSVTSLDDAEKGAWRKLAGSRFPS